jgi:gamma-glutamyltranspeptidase/glutathione hydrolase
LRRLAETGIADFYTGSAARLIVADMQRHGGLISAEDLATCGSLMEREPISLTYRAHRVLSVPPPGGGLDLLLALKILERLAPGARDSSEASWHEAIALTTSAVFREREARPLAPEDVGASALAELLSDARATRLAGEIAGVERGLPVPAGAAEEPGDTTHLAVSDTQGNVVMLTQSIQSVFGAKVAHPELGFVYNNYLYTCPRGAHPYALRGRGRPRSNACPTLVLGRDGAPFLALGSAGSRRIISSVLQTASAVIDREMDAAAAIAAARVHGLLGRKVWIERPAASEALVARLRARDREPVIRARLSYVMGAVQALHFPAPGQLVAAADPRRDGSAAAFDPGDDDEPARH